MAETNELLALIDAYGERKKQIEKEYEDKLRKDGKENTKKILERFKLSVFIALISPFIGVGMATLYLEAFKFLYHFPQMIHEIK